MMSTARSYRYKINNSCFQVRKKIRLFCGQKSVLLRKIIAMTFRGILHCGQERVTVAMIECIFYWKRGTMWRDSRPKKMRTGEWDRERTALCLKYSGTFSYRYHSFSLLIHFFKFMSYVSGSCFWKIQVKWEGKWLRKFDHRQKEKSCKVLVKDTFLGPYSGSQPFQGTTLGCLSPKVDGFNFSTDNHSFFFLCLTHLQFKWKGRLLSDLAWIRKQDFFIKRWQSLSTRALLIITVWKFLCCFFAESAISSLLSFTEKLLPLHQFFDHHRGETGLRL